MVLADTGWREEPAFLNKRSELCPTWEPAPTARDSQEVLEDTGWREELAFLNERPVPVADVGACPTGPRIRRPSLGRTDWCNCHGTAELTRPVAKICVLEEAAC